MAVFLGLDVHRAQITFDALDTDTGEVRTGKVRPGNRHALRMFLEGFDSPALVAAVEAMTGWRFVVEELQRIGAEVHELAAAHRRRGSESACFGHCSSFRVVFSCVDGGLQNWLIFCHSRTGTTDGQDGDAVELAKKT